jgi:Calpain family cysteine protease
LCQLRNPWGSGEWTGDWSDNSPLWTEELRKKVGCVAADDGTFHIPYEDYLRDYAWTSVAVDMDKDYKRSGAFKEFTAEEN